MEQHLFQILVLALLALLLLLVVIDLWVSARFARPQRRAMADLDVARMGYHMAETLLAGKHKAGKDKARIAREFCVAHGGMTFPRAAMLVQAVHAELKNTLAAAAAETARAKATLPPKA